MNNALAAAVAALALAASAAPAAAAAAAPSFESSLGALRAQVLETRAAQVKAEGAQDVTQADWDARDLSRRAMMLESTLSDLRSRAADARRSGQPAQDPLLRSQLQRALFDLRQWDSDLQMLERRTAALASSVQKDPAAAAAAQRLVDDAQDVRSDAQQITADDDWMSWDLRALGFSFEAAELERLSRDADDQARQLAFDADAILGRAR